MGRCEDGLQDQWVTANGVRLRLRIHEDLRRTDSQFERHLSAVLMALRLLPARHLRLMAVPGVASPSSTPQQFHRSARMQRPAGSAGAETLPDLGSQPPFIQMSARGCAPARGGGSDRVRRIIRLSADCLTKTYNQSCSRTLLHEFGHIVDHAYGAISGLRRIDAALYDLLANTAHEGATRGDSERFADCYMIYFGSHIAQLSYTHPADPSAYRGQARMRRFMAMLRSPAFGMPAPGPGVSPEQYVRQASPYRG